MKEKIKVCEKCYEAVIKLYRGIFISILESECPHCGRAFELDEEEKRDEM